MMLMLMMHSLNCSQVTDNVHVAIGFAIANTIIVDAPEGLIIIDTTESVEAARAAYQAIREMTDRPIKAIVYTHNHADHCYGTEVRAITKTFTLLKVVFIPFIYPYLCPPTRKCGAVSISHIIMTLVTPY